MSGVSEAARAATPAMDPSVLGREYVVSFAPFTVRRVARWVECDPAGVVYVGNFPEYLLSAVHLFRERLFGTRWIETDGRHGYQAPGKALSLVFQSSLWPDDVFDMAVYVGGVRRHTVDQYVQARRADNGALVFAGRVTSIFVAKDDRTQSVGIPAPARDAFEAYRAAHAVPAELITALREPA